MTKQTTAETPPPAPVRVHALGGRAAVVLKADEALAPSVEDGQTYQVHAEPGRVRLVGPLAEEPVSG